MSSSPQSLSSFLFCWRRERFIVEVGGEELRLQDRNMVKWLVASEEIARRLVLGIMHPGLGEQKR